jgi:hypothetical protein
LVASGEALRQDILAHRARTYSGRFDPDEFPSLFLALSRGADRLNVDPASLSPEEMKRIRGLVEQAIEAVLYRLTVPVTLPGGETRMERFLDVVLPPVLRLDPEATPFVSAGVVRATIAFIHDQMQRGLHERTPKTPEETLHSLISGAADLPSLDVRGVGSDIDFFLRSKSARIKDLSAAVIEALNSAQNENGGRLSGDVGKSIFAVGDVKDYDEQTARSVKQGGCTADFLAFNLRTRKIEEPPATDRNAPSIFEELLRGRIHYAAAPDGDLENAADTALRGTRHEIEMPWVSYDGPGGENLLAAIRSLRAQVDAGTFPDFEGEDAAKHMRALGQIDKAARNAREGAAHNRYAPGRVREGTIEAEISALFEALSAQLRRPVMPEFVDYFPIDGRGAEKAELNGLPEALLTAPKDFVEQHTDQGVLYHGTPRAENGLAIVRGGLFLSKDNQGLAAYGRGAYAKRDLATAQMFAGNDGIVFNLRVDPSRPLNILDWEAVKDDPWMKRLAEGKTLDETFETLAREHGIDIIINEHVLIQNGAAVQGPTSPADLVASFAPMITNPNATASARISAFNSYANLYQFAVALGRDDLAPPSEFAHAFAAEVLDDSRPAEARIATVRGLIKYGSTETLKALDAGGLVRSLLPCFGDPSCAAADQRQLYLAYAELKEKVGLERLPDTAEFMTSYAKCLEQENVALEDLSNILWHFHYLTSNGDFMFRDASLPDVPTLVGPLIARIMQGERPVDDRLALIGVLEEALTRSRGRRASETRDALTQQCVALLRSDIDVTARAQLFTRVLRLHEGVGGLVPLTTDLAKLVEDPKFPPADRGRWFDVYEKVYAKLPARAAESAPSPVRVARGFLNDFDALTSDAEYRESPTRRFGSAAREARKSGRADEIDQKALQAATRALAAVMREAEAPASRRDRAAEELLELQLLVAELDLPLDRSVFDAAGAVAAQIPASKGNWAAERRLQQVIAAMTLGESSSPPWVLPPSTRRGLERYFSEARDKAITKSDGARIDGLLEALRGSPTAPAPQSRRR